MKILIVCQFFYPEMFSINDVAFELVKRGHEVMVVTGKPNYGLGHIIDGFESLDDEVIRGVRIHRCKLRPRKHSRYSIMRNYLSFWSSSKKYLKNLKEDFDVVYSMSLSPLISVVGGTLYAKNHHVRHVLHCLDLWPESPLVTGAVKRGSWMHRTLKKWCTKIYSQLDEIMISSPSFESYLRETLHVENVPISFVPQPPQISLPEREVTYETTVNFVYAGNIGTLQLVENVVLAAEIARQEANIHLHVIGMGMRSNAVKKIIKDKHLEDTVTFYGIKPRPETASFYKNATALIVPLKHEGVVGNTIPSKLNSSMYYGRPILAVIGGDGRKVLEEAGGALFSEGEQPEDIAKVMVRFAALSKGELDAMGKKNAEYFSAHYKLDTIVDEIIAHLEK